MRPWGGGVLLDGGGSEMLGFLALVPGEFWGHPGCCTRAVVLVGVTQVTFGDPLGTVPMPWCCLRCPRIIRGPPGRCARAPQVSDDEYTKLLSEGIQPVATIDPNFASFTYTPRSLPEDDTSMVRARGGRGMIPKTPPRFGVSRGTFAHPHPLPRPS